MWPKRSWAYVLSAVTSGSLLCLAGAGCDSGGPVEPEPASLSVLFGSQLYRADGSSVGVQVLENVAVIGIYFASTSCSACGAFTPLLVDAYNQLREDQRSFEVVLATFEVTDAAMFEYMVNSEMPWLAVSSQSGKADSLADRYGVYWVPTLVVIDGAGNTLSLEGREEVTQKGAAAYDDWLAASAGG